MSSVEDELWLFCQTLYRQAGTEPLLLNLQDDAGMHIPLALLLIWFDLTGREADSATLTRLQQSSESWQSNVIAPLRHARRWMKTNTGLAAPQQALREQIKSAELAAEQQWLRSASAQAPPPRSPPGQALSHFTDYLQTLTVPAAQQAQIIQHMRQAIERLPEK